MLVLLGFYFLEFCLFTITAVANRAIIVAFFNSQVRAITEEQDRLRHSSSRLRPSIFEAAYDFETQSWILKLDKSKDDILLDSREELEDVFKA